MPPWPTAMPPLLTPDVAGLEGVPLTTDPIAHLMRRATFGPTARDIAAGRDLGAAGWLEQQLRPARLADDLVERTIARRYPYAYLDGPQLAALQSQAPMDVTISDIAVQQLRAATLLRMTCSTRQLKEAVIDVWDQHFNIPADSQRGATRGGYEGQVLRPLALGRFADLLQAVTFSPAMLIFLNADTSTADNPNENLGRELLELHSVGSGHYGETDVQQCAKLLTGLSVTAQGAYEYHPDDHYVGPIAVMGFRDANATATGGEAAVRRLVRYLANHPATAARVARKLAIRFVSDNPSSQLLKRLETTYLAYDTAIEPVLRVLFSDEEFWASVGSKYRRPLEWVTAALRAVDTTPSSSDPRSGEPDAWADWVGVLDGLAQGPLSWVPPNGYPDVRGPWLSAAGTLGRWNAAVRVTEYADSPGLSSTPAERLFPRRPATCGAMVDALASRLLGQPVASAERSALLAHLGREAGSPVDDQTWTTRLHELCWLLHMSPLRMLR
jgi:uncharacterized protein (DUF1800 family)